MNVVTKTQHMQQPHNSDCAGKKDRNKPGPLINILWSRTQLLLFLTREAASYRSLRRVDVNTIFFHFFAPFHTTYVSSWWINQKHLPRFMT